MQYRMCCILHQMGTVIEGYDLYIFGQDIIIQFVYFGMDQVQHFFGIFTFTHHDNTFYDIVIIIEMHLPQARLFGFYHFSHILYQNGYTIGLGDNNIIDLINIVQQTNTAYDIALSILFDHIASNIDITFIHRFIHIQGR
ncbi:hypothetical protein D3C86_1460700 [compost metagenome]